MIALTLSALLAAAAPPSVDLVVVFPDRAQVTRVAEVACGAKQRADFTDISPAAGADSFRARTSEGTVLGLRSELLPRLEEFAPQLKDTQDKLKAIDDQLAVLQQARTRLDAQGRLAEQFATVAVILSVIFNRERMRWWQGIGVGATAIGVSLMALGG